MEKIRIVIAENYTILRKGLRALLALDPGFEVVGEAGDGLEAISCVGKRSPDLVLIDLSMPRMNGTEAIKEIKRRFPKTKIIVLTVHDVEEYLHGALTAGADGYLLKTADYEELVLAVKSVMADTPYLSPGISRTVIDGYLEGHRSLKADTPWSRLSQREREVLKLIAEGFKNREIAEFLCISPKTVGKHRSNLMKKLDLHNAATLTAFAIDKGLVTR